MDFVLTNQQFIDNAEERQRNDIHNEFEDDEFFYADHEEEFNNMLESGVNEELSYEYENVLNGSTNTFGIEIEFVNGDPDAIASELYDLGICGYNRQVRYHHPSVSGKWKLERDSSVPSGGELVSPPLKDTPETWRNLEKICEVAKRHGAELDFRCGGHIHIDSSPLDTARYRWKRLFHSTGAFENVLYRVSGGDSGMVRSNVNTYASSFIDNSTRMLRNNFRLNDSDDLANLTMRASRNDRYKLINLTNIHSINKPNTVEFRSFNSSLDPKILQTNVKIANGIIFASEKARFSDAAESEAMKRRGKILENHPIRRRIADNDNSVRDFVDVSFTRKKDKDAVLKLYSKNQWFTRQ
jgi:hypothetical protein